MSSNFENFHPKLRKGRVIPQGSRIIFETDDPFNQIILPMRLADLVLLCSGQFSVREIIEKIYKKQGAVPFRSILQAMHMLHQGGFFENGNELILNTQLHSWMEPRQSRWNLSWRFGQRIVADRKSPIAYYILTMIILIGALLGLESFPDAPFKLAENWIVTESVRDAFIKLFVCSSLVQTMRHLIRGIQLLLLTGKAYNVSLRLSPWGLHLHVGHETNDLFDNRLYTGMFHLSQIFLGWTLVFCMVPAMIVEWVTPLLILNTVLTFWELNPFANSEGLRLLQAVLITPNGDFAAQHFEASSVIQSLNDGSFLRNRTFARACTLWGTLWLISAFVILHEVAVAFGPLVLGQLTHMSSHFAPAALGFLAWLAGMYLVVQSFIETIVVSVVQPHWRRLRTRMTRLVRNPATMDSTEALVERIQHLPLFSHFHEDDLERIITVSQVVEFRAKAFIILQGDLAKELYVLLEGEVEIARNSGQQMQWITELAPPSIFGEAALLGESPRAAQVSAKSTVRLLKIPVSVIRQVAEESQVIRQLDDFRNAILVNQFFASSPVFRSLSNQSIEFLCSRGALEYFDAHQVVFNQGDQGDSIYLILRGSVEVEVHGRMIKTMTQGNFFGEIALIANLPRTATIITSEACVMFRISADTFWEVLVQHIDLGVFVETVSENRLMEGLKAIPQVKPTGSDK